MKLTEFHKATKMLDELIRDWHRQIGCVLIPDEVEVVAEYFLACAGYGAGGEALNDFYEPTGNHALNHALDRLQADPQARRSFAELSNAWQRIRQFSVDPGAYELDLAGGMQL